MSLQQALEFLLRLDFKHEVRITDKEPVLVKKLSNDTNIQVRLDVDDDDVIFSMIVNGMLGDVVTSSPEDAPAKAQQIITDTMAAMH